jgi:formamidopyrimidine-DNA glycosylase
MSLHIFVSYKLFKLSRCQNIHGVNITTENPQPYNKIGDGPEGPEIRTWADNWRPILKNTLITKAQKLDRAVTLGFENLPLPSKITNVTSHGKKLLITLNTNYLLIFSFGMEGRLQFEQTKHSNIIFEITKYDDIGPFRVLKDSFSVYFHDHRYMGGLDVIPFSGANLYFSMLGPDILQASLDNSTWIPIETWISRYTQKKLQNKIIADVLGDQSIFSSIGNYIRSELLYHAKINPLRKVSTLTRDEWERLRVSAHTILLLSYSQGGCTIRSYISPDGQAGKYQCVIYGKKGQRDPDGHLIISHKNTKSDQKLYYVPDVQL